MQVATVAPAQRVQAVEAVVWTHVPAPVEAAAVRPLAALGQPGHPRSARAVCSQRVLVQAGARNSPLAMPLVAPRGRLAPPAQSRALTGVRAPTPQQLAPMMRSQGADAPPGAVAAQTGSWTWVQRQLAHPPRSTPTRIQAAPASLTTGAQRVVPRLQERAPQPVLDGEFLPTLTTLQAHLRG